MKKFLLSSAALVALATSPAFSADIMPVPPVLPPVEPVVQPFSWSGFYFGAHGGALYLDQEDDGCGAFRDITGEGGGAPTFESADDIELISDNGFFEFPSGRDGEGCFDGKIDTSDSPNDKDIVPAFNLDGDFVALTGGDNDDDDDDDDDIEFMGGVQVGINQQYGRLVLGLEGDISGVFDDDGDEIEFEYFHGASDLGDDNPELKFFQGTGTVEGGDLEWLATFRGRLGGAVGAEGRGLLYLTGGLALAGQNGLSGEFNKDDDKDWCKDCDFGDDTDDDIRVGFAAGVGGEYAFTNSFSFGAEYLFLGFDDEGGESLTFFGDDGRSFSFENDIDDIHMIRGKINVRFPPGGWGG
jgi:outer membrane immunogenic protein